MKLMHVELIVSDLRLYDLMKYLESVKAYNVQVRPFSNDATSEEEPKVNKKRGPRKGTNIKETSRLQQEWVLRHVKSEMTGAELRTAWAKTEFRDKGLYGALQKAVKNKYIKRMAHGSYKPIGGA